MRVTLLAVLLLTGLATQARGNDLAAFAAFEEGITTDTSGVHRLKIGGAMGFGRVGVDAGIQLEIWDPYEGDDIGTKIQGAGLNVGTRVNLLDEDHFVGPHVTAGAAYLRLRQEYSQKRYDAGIRFSGIGPSAYGFNAGIGYGFRTTAKVTIAVRLEMNYWIISEGEPMRPAEYPDMNLDALSFHLMLEMLRFK